MKKESYRLGELRITSFEAGQLWWERHSAVGSELGGRCFMHKDLLIIGPCSSEEGGYLIGEFADDLRKLPLWNRTRYYCFISELLDAATGQKLSGSPIDLLAKERRGPGPGNFRLERYAIAVTREGKISWQTSGEGDRIAQGECVIESDVLFIGQEESNRPGQGKKDFMEWLGRLPLWGETLVWAPGPPVPVSEERKAQGFSPSPPKKNVKPEEKSIIQMEPPQTASARMAYISGKFEKSGKHAREGFKHFLVLGNMLLKKMGNFRIKLGTGRKWPEMPGIKLTLPKRKFIPNGKKLIKFLIPVAIAAALFGLMMSLEELEEFFGHEEHHYKELKDHD